MIHLNKTSSMSVQKVNSNLLFYSNSTGSSPMDKVQFDLSIGVNPVL